MPSHRQETAFLTSPRSDFAPVLPKPCMLLPMRTYHAILMHGNRDSEGRYEFEAPELLAQTSAVRIMQAFMEHVEAQARVGHIDYEINAAMKNEDAGVVTVLGELKFETGSAQPFVCMIEF